MACCSSAGSLHAAPDALHCRPSRLQRRSGRQPRTSCAASSSTPPVLPQSAASQVRQCAQAVAAALADGVSLQRVELELPLIGATDLDDWPGGTRQQLKAATPLVLQLMTELAGGVSVRVAQTPIDPADGVLLFTTSQQRAVTFVTADTLAEVQALRGERDAGLLLLVNAEWKEEDWGWGIFTNTRIKNFADSAVETFSVRRLRIRGQDLRVVRSYPSAWALYAIGLDGERDKIEVIGSTAQRPSYAEAEAALAALGKRSIANADLSTRLRSEYAFNKDSAKDF